jgi:magnesium-transporting ATPase (P-type)
MVLLVWAILTFILAIFTYTFLGFGTSIKGDNFHFNEASHWIVTITGVLVLLLIMVAVYSFWRIWLQPRWKHYHTYVGSEKKMGWKRKIGSGMRKVGSWIRESGIGSKVLRRSYSDSGVWCVESSVFA